MEKSARTTTKSARRAAARFLRAVQYLAPGRAFAMRPLRRRCIPTRYYGTVMRGNTIRHAFTESVGDRRGGIGRQVRGEVLRELRRGQQGLERGLGRELHDVAVDDLDGLVEGRAVGG